MKPILLATHDYLWAVHVFAHLYRKHWSADPITWYGDWCGSGPPEGVEFRRVPAYQMGVWPWDHWFANGLMSILRELEDDIICLLLPDHWISAPVDVEAVAVLERFMRDTGKVLRGNLTAGTCLDQHGRPIRREGPYRIVTVEPTDHHCSFGGGLTFCPSLWSRELMLRVLEPHWDLWACEKVGTEKFAREFWKRGYISAGVTPPPLRRTHGLSHAAPRAVNLRGLEPEDAAFARAHVPEGWEAIV